MKNLIICLFTICCILFLSCKKNEKRNEAESIITEWIGKTIIFPENIPCTILNKDTVCPELFDAEYKILVYADSTGCTDCKLRLLEWKDMVEETDSIMPYKLEYLFYFQPKSKKIFHTILNANEFTYPVFIDEKNTINRLNAFPIQSNYHTFLLDKKNKVLAIGNPILNPKIKDLYKKIITRNNK